MQNRRWRYYGGFGSYYGLRRMAYSAGNAHTIGIGCVGMLLMVVILCIPWMLFTAFYIVRFIVKVMCWEFLHARYNYFPGMHLYKGIHSTLRYLAAM